jgi:hypothetical protein
MRVVLDINMDGYETDEEHKEAVLAFIDDLGSTAVYDCTKATYQRLGEVIVKYGVKVISSFALGATSDRATSFTLLLEVPEEHLQEVASHLKVTLSEPMQLHIPYMKEKK